MAYLTGKSAGLAILALTAAVIVRWLLDPLMGDTLQLVTLFGAVAIAVWLGGYRLALVIAVLGYLACAYLFIPPRGRIVLDDAATLVGLGAYLFTCALIVAFGEAMRRANARANERASLLQITLASIGDAVITTDVGGRITYANGVAESLTGWSLRDAVGHPLDAVFRIVGETTREPVANPATRALREGVVVGLANHTLLLRRDGSECPIDDSAAPIRDEQGHVSGCVLVFRDVTQQRTIEREKAAQLMTAQLLASIISSSDDAIVSKNLDGVIQSWNAAAEHLFGHTADHAIGRHISLIIPPDRLAEEDVIISRLKAGDRIDHFETERMRADGRRIVVSLTISPVKDASGQVVGASKIVRDISERRRAEEERQKFVTLVESSTDFIGMCDLEGIPFFVNRAGLELVGLDSIEQARRLPVSEFFFPEDRPRILQEFFPKVLQTGHGEIEVRFRNFSTGEARWMAYKVVTLHDTGGRPVGYATVSQDVTERRQLADDLRRLAVDLSEADRRKNEFLAMLAHELRNPLAPISNATRALRMGVTDEKTVRTAAAMLERQVGQLARLVDDLLDMSRITQGRIDLRRERVEIAPIVRQAVEATRALYRAMDHELSVDLPPDPVYLDADPTRLAQAIGNLLNNACKFTDQGGQVRLSVESGDGQAVVRVRDNGIGISRDQLARIFDMFAQADTSLERSRDGLGIGLTLVKTLIELHGGRVEAHSDGPGRGSEFILHLPIAAAPAVQAPSTARRDPAPARRRILIVDDSRDAAESLAMMLQFDGHETHLAHDGFEAIDAARRLQPDAILLDIGLPRLNGYQACRRIREERWGQSILLVALTGWGQDEDRERSREAGFDTHLVKPVDYDLLTNLLAALPGDEARRAERVSPSPAAPEH